MTSRLESIPAQASLDQLYSILERGLVALVVDGDRFLGLITRADFLSYLRRKL